MLQLLVAVVAVLAVAMLVVNVVLWRQLRASRPSELVEAPARPDATPVGPAQPVQAAEPAPLAHLEPYRPAETEEIITTDGRVVVPPSNVQVVNATMGKTLVRGSILIHGLRHALRPESRDRIRGLMRREYHHRRKARLRAGRRAARVTPDATASTPWISGDQGHAS